MRHFYFIVFLISLFIFTSCDPTHDIHLQNSTDKDIEVIVFPVADKNNLGQQTTKQVQLNGQDMTSITLGTTESISIGHVVAMYTPQQEDFYYDYIEIHIGLDTIRLAGKDTIFSRLQKTNDLDWRLIITN